MVHDKGRFGGRLFAGANTGSVGDSIQEYVVRCAINDAHFDTPILEREWLMFRSKPTTLDLKRDLKASNSNVSAIAAMNVSGSERSAAFLGTDTRTGNTSAPQRSAGVGNADRGYLADEARPKGTGGFWTVEYYQSYFDVDTKTVLERCYQTMNPLAAATYVPTHLTPADLYGPFWTLTTLIFALFLSSSLAASISAYLGSQPEYDYDFKLLSIAMSLVYAYGLALPVLLWLALRYLGVGEWSVVEAVSLWGYGQFVWIPVSVLCVVPVPIARWVLVGVAFGLSGYFLGANIYPILASAEAKATRLLIIILALLHFGLALTFKVLFFNYYVVDKIGGDIPIPGVPGDTPAPGNTTVVARWW